MKPGFVLFLILLPIIGSTQNLSRTGVTQAKVRNTGSILQHGLVKGYYYFYNLEKKDKKNNNYLLSVVDENLREVNKVTITRPTNYQLIESSYNGQAFLFLFFDAKKKETELISYDNSLNQIGQFLKPIASAYTYNVYQSIALGNSASQRYLIPIQDNGFIQYGPGTIEHYDNSLKLIWDSSAEDKKNAVTPSEAFQSDKMVGSIITHATSRNSALTYVILVNDLQTGALKFQCDLTAQQYNVSPSDIHFDSTKQQIVIFGEYFNKNDKQTNSQSLGFCYLNYDVDGKQVTSKLLSWADISQKAPVNEKGKFDGINTNILFHDFVRTSDGQIFAIGEQYKKAVSGAGVGLQVLSVLAAAGTGYYRGSAAAVQLNVYNMVVFQFNADYSLEKVHLFEKNKSQMLLPAGATYYSSKELAYYGKMRGGFDFRFSQEFPGNETFAIVYVDAERASSKAILGAIIYTPEKVFAVDKTKFDRRSEEFSIMRAKPGYILIAEYFRKEKRFDMRLEKMNY